MPGEKILIIEDEPALLRGLTDNFLAHGFQVVARADGESGLLAALHEQPDLILLDIMLPKVNGYEICRQVRTNGNDVPIIMLTAKTQEEDIVLGLNLGADDYVTKPFSIRELLARANAFLRRRRHAADQAYTFGDCSLDPQAHRLTRAGEPVELTPKEFSLLHMLVRRAGRAFTRDEILRTVWGDDVWVTGRSVDRCINTLRGKIEPDPRRPIFIQTVRDIGYRFELPSSSD